MARVTQQHIDARIEAIKAAAEKVFAERGFTGATMQEIAAEAGISAGAIYRYFPGKEALIHALNNDRHIEHGKIVDAIRSKGDTKQVLTGLADTFFSPLEDPQSFLDQCIEFELVSEARRNPEIRRTVSQGYDTMVASFTAVIRRGQAEGAISKSVDAESVARIMIASFEGLTMQLAVGQKAHVPKYTKALKAMMTGTLWTAAGKEKAR
jgi:AcrR family transcriptional regulator